MLCEMAVNSTEDEDQWLYGKDELRMLQLYRPLLLLKYLNAVCSL